MKKHRMLRNAFIDLACAGLALIVFALFHHVLPRQQESLGIVIRNPNQTEAADQETSLTLPDDTLMIASAGLSDVSVGLNNATGSLKEASDNQSDTTDGLSGATASLPDASAGESARNSKQNKPGGRRRNRDGGTSGANSASGKGSTSSKGSRGGTGGKGGMNGKGGSALTEDGTSALEETDDTPISEKFADQYTDTVVVTENSYSSPDIAITVTEETLGRTTYYLADIYVRDITCFQSALAENTYGSGFRDSITDMALLNNALLAVNGDYYGNTSEGVVIRNGVIYRANQTNCDVCVLYYDGTMRVIPGNSFSEEEAIAQGAWQAWTFGPALLDTDGSVLTTFASSSRIISANPRTAIGYYEPGHYCLVVVDGRGESAGITLPDLSQLFYDLGCTAAYNLDGGNSSIMVWNNEVINDPSGGGRESSDALLITEVNSHE